MFYFSIILVLSQSETKFSKSKGDIFMSKIRLMLFKIHHTLSEYRDIIFYLSLILHWTSCVIPSPYLSNLATVLHTISTLP